MAVQEPQRAQGAIAPAPKGKHTLIRLQGPGVFVAGHVVKDDGKNDLSFLSLVLDGRNVIATSFAAVRKTGFTQDNPFGLVALQSSSESVDNVAFGFPEPLRFEDELRLIVDVQEDGVQQLLAEIVHGSA